MNANNPDLTRATGDPGDDTARRFAYQWTVAAMLACSLFDGTADVIELFCEHHEDILLKRSNGQFSGWQVKTRDLGGLPWTATDEAVLAACVRFVRLESRFPGSFRDFVLATNHTFLTGKTGRCLPFLLDCADQATDESSGPPILQKYITRLAKASGCATSVAFSTLKKCRYDHSLPKLNDIKQALMNTLSEGWEGANEAAVRSLRNAAEALIAECQRASSLDHAQTLPGYLRAAPAPAELEARMVIEGKRFDRARVEKVLRGALSRPTLLEGPALPPGDEPRAGSARLEPKLIAGGFSAVSIASAKDLRNKADYQSMMWMGRFGEGPGLARRDHIRSIVLRDCATAFEIARASPAPFGVRMLAAFRAEVQGRRQAGETPMLDCLDEHLEGYAYGLTDECSVWWSEPPVRVG